MIHFATVAEIGMGLDVIYPVYAILCDGTNEDDMLLWESTTDVSCFFRHDDRCQACEDHEDFGIILLEGL